VRFLGAGTIAISAIWTLAKLAKPVVGGLGISILTTPRGLMSGRAARRSRVGGELLCEVW